MKASEYIGHKHYSTNTSGRDFVVGDLHGCFDELRDAMKQINFNKSYDRMFSVGDLIDRGPNSMDCASLVYEPWFHSVQGNHENMFYHSIIFNNAAYLDCWLGNGGMWAANEDMQLLEDIATQFHHLPLTISVGEGDNRFNIIHAELYKPSDNPKHWFKDSDIDNWTLDHYDVDNLLWGRRQYEEPLEKLIRPTGPALSPTFVGHTPVPLMPISINNHIYIDTGHVFAHRQHNPYDKARLPLTIACPTEQLFYQYKLPLKEITVFPFNAMKVR